MNEEEIIEEKRSNKRINSARKIVLLYRSGKQIDFDNVSLWNLSNILLILFINKKRIRIPVSELKEIHIFIDYMFEDE